MEWRCAWCGKPHEEDDPPCDNCGHGEFERAVVPVAPDSDTTQGGHVWVCTQCGHDHPKHTPPCDRCGNTEFERRRLADLDDGLATAPDDDNPSADVGYLDVLEARYVAGYLAVGLLGLVLVLGYAGVVDLPWAADDPPEVEDVPGNPTTAGGLSLAEVEDAYLAELNGRRRADGREELAADADLGAVATYDNQRRVKAREADGSTPSNDALAEYLGEACSSRPVRYAFVVPPGSLPDGSVAGFESAASFGRALAAERAGRAGGPGGEGTATGVDVHVGADGSVYVTQFVC